jgi:hypothetical protein
MDPLVNSVGIALRNRAQQVVPGDMWGTHERSKKWRGLMASRADKNRLDNDLTPEAD